MADANDLSKRMSKSVASMLPHIAATITERTSKGPAKIDLGTAENWLLRPELLEICKEAIAQSLTAEEFSYPRGFGGDPKVLEALASFFNSYICPSVPVQPDHVVVTPGVSSCLDTLLYNICDDGDSVLVPAPYWSGFDHHFHFRSSVTVIPVYTSTSHLSPTSSQSQTGHLTESLSSSLIPALTRAYSSNQSPARIKALILTNPHNPLSLCYHPSVLRQCMSWCQKRGIHFVSDEMYALSEIATQYGDMNEAVVPFVSALKVAEMKAEDLEGELVLPAEEMSKVDRSKVHVVWGMSKDFGSSGIRLGCIITQFNPALRTGMALLNSTTVSSLPSLFTATLLTSPRLPALLALNTARLTTAFSILRTHLQRWDVEFIPPNAGLYVFAKLGKNIDTQEGEDEMVQSLKSEGVLVAGGKSFKVGIMAGKGWVRIVFSVPEKVLLEGLRRVEKCLFAGSRVSSQKEVQRKKRYMDANGDVSEVDVLSKRIMVE